MNRHEWLASGVHRSGLVLVALLGLVLNGCAGLNLAPDYDPVMDQTVTELQADTATFFEKMGGATGQAGSYSANKGFYDQAIGTVEAMSTRAATLEADLAAEHRLLNKNFAKLRQQYMDMRLLHQTNPSKTVIASAKNAFDQMFEAILMHIRSLKTGTANATGS